MKFQEDTVPESKIMGEHLEPGAGDLEWGQAIEEARVSESQQ